MTLSETCFEAIEMLVDSYHNSLDWDYLSQHWDQYIQAIQLLADIAFQQDAFVELGEIEDISSVDQDEYLRQARKKAKNFVLEQLMQGEPNEYYNAAKLAGVATVSPWFCALMADVKDWRRSPYGIAEILKQERPVDFEAWCREIEEEIPAMIQWNGVEAFER